MTTAAEQLHLVKRTWSKDHFAFGGALLKGSHPKKKRPFRSSLPLHVVMRSSQAQGRHSLLHFNREIEAVMTAQAERHGVKIFGAANAGNHLHLVIQAPSRGHFVAFMRGLAGRVAQIVMGAKREQRRESFGKAFWDARPFTRVLSWGRDFKNVARYIGINATETALSATQKWTQALSRSATRRIFSEIREALQRGWLKKSPSLVAAGFV